MSVEAEADRSSLLMGVRSLFTYADRLSVNVGVEADRTSPLPQVRSLLTYADRPQRES